MLEFFKKLFSPITFTLNFIQNYFKSIVFITILIFITSSGDPQDFEIANLQKINLNGPIIGADDVVEKIEKAKKDKNIKGVLFIVDSPGGAVAPSVEMAYAIKELKEIKPVVAYASGIMASGSYYASIWADKIVANPGSMIGSIGVIFQSFNIEEVINKLGIKPQTVKAGKYKESGTPLRAWKDYEEKEIKTLIDDTYESFVSDVANARGLKEEDHTKFADAHVFTPYRAKSVGLIDEIGTISVAKNELVKLANVQKPVWSKEDKFEKMMDKFLQESSKVFINTFWGLKAY
jgi:protease-4